jgi:hypothetical protein
VFFGWRTANFFFPHTVTSVTLYVVFAVRYWKTHGKNISLSCAKGKRTAKIYVCRAFYHSARQSIFKKIVFCTSFNFSTSKTLFCTIHFNHMHVSINLLFLTIMCRLKNFCRICQIWTASP